MGGMLWAGMTILLDDDSLRVPNLRNLRTDFTSEDTELPRRRLHTDPQAYKRDPVVGNVSTDPEGSIAGARLAGVGPGERDCV